MSGLAEPLRVATRIGQTLDTLGVRWALVGAMASSLHGVPRETHEVEVVAALSSGQVDALVADWSTGFFVERARVVQAIVERSSFTAVHVETMTKVRVTIARGEPALAKAMLDRRVMFRIYASEAILPALSAEDTVLYGLAQAHRQQRGPAWDDVVGVLRHGAKTLDLAYLRRSAKAARLVRPLDEALAAAGIRDRGPIRVAPGA